MRSETAAPPRSPARSSTSTERPARASSVAATRPLWPPPTTTTSYAPKGSDPITTWPRRHRSCEARSAFRCHAIAKAAMGSGPPSGDVDEDLADGTGLHGVVGVGDLLQREAVHRQRRQRAGRERVG